MPEETKKRILLVDDDELILATVAKVLEEAGYEAICASSGRTAHEIYKIEPFDLVLSDIHMPSSGVSGIQLLDFVKRMRPAPVILMTGFATAAMTREANDAGADLFLAKPFNKEDLIQAVESVCGKRVSPPLQSQDENYCKISIDDFVSGKEIKYKIFVRLSETKYVKIADRGEDLSLDRIQIFRSKGILYLYMLKSDFHDYLKFNLGLTTAVKLSRKIDPQKKAHFMRHTTEVLMEMLFNNQIEQGELDQAQSVVQNTVGYLSENAECFDLMSTLNSHADFIYAHSLGVSLFSTLIAKEVGWRNPATLYKLSMGGILHDIGCKFIERDILLKPKRSLSATETKVFETHSLRGMEALSRIPCVSGDILQIVMMHHERDSGTGYPSGLSKSKIHPLARLLAVADEFCNLVIQSPESPALPPKEALERLSTHYVSVLDSGYLAALMRVFKMETPPNLSSSTRLR